MLVERNFNGCRLKPTPASGLSVAPDRSGTGFKITFAPHGSTAPAAKVTNVGTCPAYKADGADDQDDVVAGTNAELLDKIVHLIPGKLRLHRACYG